MAGFAVSSGHELRDHAYIECALFSINVSTWFDSVIFNPRRMRSMRRRVTVVVLCVCMYVCMSVCLSVCPILISRTTALLVKIKVLTCNNREYLQN